MRRVGPGPVAGVQRLAPDDQLVGDRVAVHDHEPDPGPLDHPQVDRLEQRVLDVELHRHRAGAEDRGGGVVRRRRRHPVPAGHHRGGGRDRGRRPPPAGPPHAGTSRRRRVEPTMITATPAAAPTATGHSAEPEDSGSTGTASGSPTPASTSDGVTPGVADTARS